MNKTYWRRALLAAKLLATASLLMVGAVACSDSNAGGCNACPQTDLPLTAAQCQAAAKAAGCASAELVEVPGDAGVAACGQGVPYQACNWTNCNGKVNACQSSIP